MDRYGWIQIDMDRQDQRIKHIMDAKHVKTKTYGERVGWIWTDMDQHTVDDMDR